MYAGVANFFSFNTISAACNRIFCECFGSRRRSAASLNGVYFDAELGEGDSRSSAVTSPLLLKEGSGEQAEQPTTLARFQKWMHTPLVRQETLKTPTNRGLLIFFCVVWVLLGTFFNYYFSNFGVDTGSSGPGVGPSNSTALGVDPSNTTASVAEEVGSCFGPPSAPVNGSSADFFDVVYDEYNEMFGTVSILLNVVFSLDLVWNYLLQAALKEESWTPLNLLVCLLAQVGAPAAIFYLSIAQESSQVLMDKYDWKGVAWSSAMQAAVWLSVLAMMDLNVVCTYDIFFKIYKFCEGIYKDIKAFIKNLFKDVLTGFETMLALPSMVYLGVYTYYFQLVDYIRKRNSFDLQNPSCAKVGALSIGNLLFGLFYSLTGLQRIFRAFFRDFYDKASGATSRGGAFLAILNLLFMAASTFFVLFFTIVPALRTAERGRKIDMALTTAFFNANSAIRLVNMLFSLLLLNFAQAMRDVTQPLAEPSQTGPEVVQASFNTQMPWEGIRQSPWRLLCVRQTWKSFFQSINWILCSRFTGGQRFALMKTMVEALDQRLKHLAQVNPNVLEGDYIVQYVSAILEVYNGKPVSGEVLTSAELEKMFYGLRSDSPERALLKECLIVLGYVDAMGNVSFENNTHADMLTQQVQEPHSFSDFRWAMRAERRLDEVIAESNAHNPLVATFAGVSHQVPSRQPMPVELEMSSMPVGAYPQPQFG